MKRDIHQRRAYAVRQWAEAWGVLVELLYKAPA